MTENIFDNGMFFCENCRKTFANPHHPKRHQSIYTGERQHKCIYCGLSFNCKSALKTHTRIHTGERPYTCNYCDRRFTENCDLTKHLGIHTGERPYTCNFCHRRFTNSQSLKRHLGTHTRERSFFSNYCNRIPTQSNNLNRDKVLHSENAPYVYLDNQIAFPGSSRLYAHQEAFRMMGELRNSNKTQLSPNFTTQPFKSASDTMNVETHSTSQTHLDDKAQQLGEIKNQKYVSVGESLFASRFCSYSSTDECDMCLHGIIH